MLFKTVNTFKKLLTKQENLFCNEDEDSIEDLNYCIASLNNLKNKYFKENQYQSKAKSELCTFIETSEWTFKKCSINPQNKDNKCFQYFVTIALNYRNIKHNSERISKDRPFINSYNWDSINQPANKQDFKTFEMNNKSIALNVLECNSQQKISHLYKSEFNKTREKQVILLMISNDQQQQQHYFMMMMMMNCFCGMVDQRKAFSLISSRDHCQRSSPSRISDTPRAGFEPEQNLSSGFVE